MMTRPMITDEMKADGWVEHDGHILPVWGNTKVTVMLRMGHISNEPMEACFYRWDKGRTPESAADESLRRNDIIAYKPEQDHANG